ncbi:hypothetical protein HPB52_024230 [Rhipicephalus sanguineus]|uniref:Uncharacterized protein n=1 Tax=Rhipicephalus sanguineus TaxID=34632 RepID=A0A9D4TCK6_RHISA|nr:hypothetical protein HPB52_024230 [Rhipicephalus sanguineus]
MQGSRVRAAHKTLLYRQVVLPALTYASPIWWSESRVDCRLYAGWFPSSVVLLALTGAFRTTNTAALQVLMQAAPIDLELERLNAEFRLFALRRYVAFGSLRYRPEWVALPHKDVVPHPSLPAVVPFRRLSRRAACHVCRAPGIHIYTDGSYTNLSAGRLMWSWTPTLPSSRSAGFGCSMQRRRMRLKWSPL